MTMNDLIRDFKAVTPSVDFCSLRWHRDQGELLKMRQDVLEPTRKWTDTGVHITIHHQGGAGYCATADTSREGLRKAIQQAQKWAEASRGRTVVDFSKVAMPNPQGEYRTQTREPWQKVPVRQRLSRLSTISKALPRDPRIVDWSTLLWFLSEERIYLTNHGGQVFQQFDYIIPNIEVRAHDQGETVSRSLSTYGFGGQGGMEILDDIGFDEIGDQLATEALQLLQAPNCPSGKMDLLLDSEQMMLQIHESIGHPIELDRILGDERNYAGTSFVNLDMFGSYRYGSELLNISFDPSNPQQIASYAFDDDGCAAQKEFLIKDGILLKPLGGCISQYRAQCPGVANSRAVAWQRPTMDRMANLNLEAGNSTFEDMVANVERGIYMRTNLSWSIDDSRNKFQFGCEWAQLIENGQLTQVVKNPNYRGISAEFWRSLKMVGDDKTYGVLSTPFCGKGEPNQAIKVGHASPACLFADIDVFGGA